jgi:hypothetical protein
MVHVFMGLCCTVCVAIGDTRLGLIDDIEQEKLDDVDKVIFDAGSR